MIGFKVLVTAGLLLIGGILVLNQEMNIGQFVAAEIIIVLVIGSVEKLITGLESFYDVLTSLEKLGQVVDKELEPQGGEIPFKEDEGFAVELDQVSYATGESHRKILDDISLTITKSCTMLIQGPNSSGKSTLLRMIAGLIQPDSGNVYINNVEVRGLDLNQYRSYLGQSLTEESPFEGTILENITFGDQDIPLEDVYWAMEKVGLMQYVKEQSKGLQTVIYPEGKQISYTVSKKIVLARSIVRKPKLLILKDPLDQFDEQEVIRIMDFLTEENNPWALVVVSQNPKWIERCGRVINIEKGKVVSEK